ncbi:non-ribosomal peptide synthetase [Mycolicibacterium brumae]|uniref:non-ribosomal peptide synthetase n=1 Tax=Mycolicibacterium brumae TaxID=85968 RepID=UPI000D686A21|nr:non-ribosomal peptide synthetase [Mycolicibacterium brumae]UWW08196.1 non-ribosomal peptide synthetase [Mycolicibacterium brumae]
MTPTAVRDQVAELLGVDAETLDPDADLIASGLDSIRMMSLSGRWRRQGIDVGFAALSQNPTISAWARLLGDRAPGDSAPSQPSEQRDGADENLDEPFPLAPIQHALWLGRNAEQALGGVAPHLYVEFDSVGSDIAPGLFGARTSPLEPGGDIAPGLFGARTSPLEPGGDIAPGLFGARTSPLEPGGAVDPQRLRVAAAALARRHPMLRVQILPDGLQRITDRSLPVTINDLRELDTATADARLAEIRDRNSHQMLDGEVLQISLSLLPGGRSRLHVDMDMSAADAVSYRNFMADLAALYNGAQLPDLEYTYRQYRAALTAENGVRDADRQWWAERIPTLPEPPAPPLTPASEQTDPRRTVRRWHFFTAEQRESLFTAAQRRGVTPAMAIAGCYAGTLARWSTSEHFLLNLPMFGREPYHRDVDKLVGDFTTSLMLDVDLTDADTPAQRGRVLQESMRASAAHSSYSGLSVLRDLTRLRGVPALAPFVFTSALGLGDLFAGEVTDAFGDCVWHISQGPQVLLDAQATPFDGGLLINWDVREEAFRSGVADAMFADHIAELTRLAADDAAWDTAAGSAVPVGQQAIRDALNSVAPRPSGDRLHDGFFRAAQAQPDATAVIGAGAEWTYRQLREQALAVSATLRRRGVRPGDLVAVVGPKHADQIPALLGVHAAGAAYLPIGADQPTDRAARILVGADVRLVLRCGGEDAAAQPDSSLNIPTLRVCDAIAAGLPEAADTEPVATDPTGLAYVLFTSGSTGEPKGVEVSHDAAMNTVEFINRHFRIGPDDRALALSTLEGDISVLDVFGMLSAGGTIVMVEENQRRDPDAWVDLIQARRITVLHWLSGWLEMLVALNPVGRIATVRVVPTGGDWVRADMVRALRRLAPGVRVAGLGGATETAIHNTICEPGDLPLQWSAVPFGRPLPGNACRVVAADGTDCPDWVPGELWVGGRGVADGYRGRPDLTAEKFVVHDSIRWYRTGDLARYLPNGSLEFIGRADHRVKISGYRVELGEVEGALNRIKAVDGAVAAVVPAAGARAGVRLAALVAVTDPAMTAAQLTRALAGFVPPHMIPDVLVLTDAIPYGVGGKTDRKAAEALLAQEARRADAEPAAGRREPATPLEAALADIFAGALGADAVGPDDDFFHLGGDSVLATALVARVRDWLDTPTVMVADVFAARTAAGLAALLAGREPDPTRLADVAEVYLEVAAMDAGQVSAALEAECR